MMIPRKYKIGFLLLVWCSERPL